MQAGREHTNFTQRGFGQIGDLNPGPSYCDVVVLTTVIDLTTLPKQGKKT